MIVHWRYCGEINGFWRHFNHILHVWKHVWMSDMSEMKNHDSVIGLEKATEGLMLLFSSFLPFDYFPTQYLLFPEIVSIWYWIYFLYFFVCLCIFKSFNLTTHGKRKKKTVEKWIEFYQYIWERTEYSFDSGMLIIQRWNDRQRRRKKNLKHDIAITMAMIIMVVRVPRGDWSVYECTLRSMYWSHSLIIMHNYMRKIDN